MRSLKLVFLSSFLGLTVAAFTGCSSAQKGAAGGGLAGGIAGAIIGNNWVPVGPTSGAIMGGTGGAAIGGLVGDAYDQITQEDLERELNNLRADLAAKEAELATLRNGAPTDADLAEIQALRDQIATLQGDLDRVRAQADERNGLLADEAERLRQEKIAAEAEKELLQSDIDRLNEQKGMLEKDVQDLMNEIERLKSLLSGNEELLSKLNDQNSAKDAALAELERSLQERANALSDLERQLAEKARNLAEMENQVGALQASLSGKESALGELKGELDALNVQLEETSRGLTLTIVNSLLFSAGDHELSPDGKVLVGNVARILNDKFPGREFLIEGHTDNQPIVHSGWRSNWELGAARSLTILHELVGKHGIDPQKVSATSYGEFRPSASNATDKGRAENRRAVIVILPEKLEVSRQSLAQVN